MASPLSLGQPGVSQPKQFLISKLDEAENGFQTRLVGGYQLAFEIFQGNAILTIDAITDAEGFGSDPPRQRGLSRETLALLAMYD